MGKHGKAPTKTRYLRQKVVGHPLASEGEAQMAYQHRYVLYEKIGPGAHPCHWCGKMVEWGGKPRLVTDHLNENRHDNDPDNLVPACVRCNSKRAKYPKFMTHCKRGHEYTPETTYVRKDTGTRQCRTCARENDEKRRAKNCMTAGGSVAF